ncbi:hypothetical protein B0H16DRAFT_1563922 [Mycena metata]|uniref:Uncharacterized protein n=1 Tax=Mycena metata TaxID=1033252 RepID=A0AAD7N1A9_9AGAR|nr:hypothetical protein B0H16DRAFT_1563922 [Mycena metata]
MFLSRDMRVDALTLLYVLFYVRSSTEQDTYGLAVTRWSATICAALVLRAQTSRTVSACAECSRCTDSGLRALFCVGVTRPPLPFALPLYSFNHSPSTLSFSNANLCSQTSQVSHSPSQS